MPVRLHQWPAGHGKQSFKSLPPTMSRYLCMGQSIGASPRGQYFPRGQGTPVAVPEGNKFRVKCLGFFSQEEGDLLERGLIHFLNYKNNYH